jgi:hypothetical protein
MHARLTLVLLFASTLAANAEVLDSAPNGFSTSNTVIVTADRNAVYHAATKRLSQWWDPDHSISGDAANLYIKAVPNGCFCERLPPAGGLVHMAVTFVNPGVMLRFTGGLGPLGLMGVSGNMTWEFEDVDGGTRMTWAYAVGGYMDGGLDSIAPAVDGVLAEQMQNLASLVAGDES